MLFRNATRNDVPRLVELLADDDLGKTREDTSDPLPQAYYDAFDAIERHDGAMIVAEKEGKVIACLQLTFIPTLNLVGTLRAQLETVQVDSAYRGKQVGSALMAHAIERARQRGCGLVQLTTNKQREMAKKFYEKLDFKATHEGMKLVLNPL